MLREAQRHGYAVAAFNVENMEMAQAVVAAAEALRAPVLVQTTPGTLGYAPPELFADMVRGLGERADVPVALHLDHGNSVALGVRAARAGYTSLMIDGSTLPYEENIALAQEMVRRAQGLPVEAELGTVGGKEDGHDGGTGGYTDPAQAADYVARTGIDSLAVAIGTAHGVYRGEPRLDIDRLRAIRQAVSLPLVLHGASGISDAQIVACVAAGICKVNYATELRIAFSNGVKEALRQKPDAIDPKVYGKAGREAVYAAVCDRMRVCGAAGRA